jgi:hypothetical protein
MQIVQQKQKTFASTELMVDPPSGEVAAATGCAADPLQRLLYPGRIHEHPARAPRLHLRHMPKAKRLRQTWMPLALGVWLD